jgi:CheY-like chemotaxis protein
LIDFKPEPVLLINLEGEILLANSSAYQMLQFTEEDLNGQPLRFYFLKEAGLPNPLHNKTLQEFKDTFLVLTGTYSLLPVRVEFSEIEGQKFLCTLFQNTDEPGEKAKPANGSSKNKPAKEFQPSIYPSAIQSTNSESDYLDNHAHEIRTALNGILGIGSELLKEIRPLNNRMLENYVSILLRKANSLNETYNQKIQGSLAGKINTNLSLIPVHQFLMTQINNFQQLIDEHYVTVDFSCAEKLKITTDDSRLANIFNFFLLKSILFTHDNSIKIKVFVDDIKGRLNIELDNIGQDMPDELLQFIMSQHDTSEYNSNAPELEGYENCIQILQELNSLDARLLFRKSDKMGEVAILSLPSQIIQVDEFSEERIEQTMKQRNFRILLVEDDKINSKVISFFFKESGTLISAFSGNEALNILEREEKDGHLFDMILMDINLPEPWDGITLKEEIIHRWPRYKDVPFFAQTAHTDDTRLKKINSAGFETCFIKPFKKLQVLQRIERYVLNNHKTR